MLEGSGDWERSDGQDFWEGTKCASMTQRPKTPGQLKSKAEKLDIEPKSQC